GRRVRRGRGAPRRSRRAALRLARFVTLLRWPHSTAVVDRSAGEPRVPPDRGRTAVRALCARAPRTSSSRARPRRPPVLAARRGLLGRLRLGRLTTVSRPPPARPVVDGAKRGAAGGG